STCRMVATTSALPRTPMRSGEFPVKVPSGHSVNWANLETHSALTLWARAAPDWPWMPECTTRGSVATTHNRSHCQTAATGAAACRRKQGEEGCIGLAAEGQSQECAARDFLR